MSSFLNQDSFEAGVGNVPSFAKIDNSPLWVSAGVTFSTAVLPKTIPTTPVPTYSNNEVLVESYDRWTFLKKGADGKTLHDKISDCLKANLDSKSRQVLDQQEADFDKAFKNWVITADFGVAEPDFDGYPALKNHLQNVQTVESGITRTVFAGLTAEEKIIFQIESEPLKPGQKSRQMTEAVLKRINEETVCFLNANNFSQREHNRT